MTFRIIFFILISFQLLANDCKKPQMPPIEEWNSWLHNIKLEAIKEGISKETVYKELEDKLPQKKIILRDRCQPESTITLDEYLYYRLDKARTLTGKKILEEHRVVLNKIGDYFGIQPRFIVAILGMESYYGKYQGEINTIDAITTLAFDRRRSSFYKKQLFAALKIIDDEFAKTMGAKDLQDFKKTIKDQMQKEIDNVSKTNLKKSRKIQDFHDFRSKSMKNKGNQWFSFVFH